MNTFSQGYRTFNPLKRVAEIRPQIFVYIYTYKHLFYVRENCNELQDFKILMRKDAGKKALTWVSI